MATRTFRALALLTAGMLAACTPAFPDSHQHAPPEPLGPVLLSGEQILAEYHAETERLQLAPGDSWNPRPAVLASGPEPDGTVMFEQGVGAQTAQFHWYCSWASTALSDEGKRDVALSELETFPTLSVWEHMDHNGHALFQHIHDEAALGNLAVLAEYVASSCEQHDPAAVE